MPAPNPLNIGTSLMRNVLSLLLPSSLIRAESSVPVLVSLSLLKTCAVLVPHEKLTLGP